MELGRTRALRWALPAGAAIAVAALIAGAAAATAQPAPALPPRTAAQLLAGVARASGPVPLTGTYTETANLGLPDLPGGSDPLSAPALLSGSHTFMIWSGDAQELRIAEPVQLGEADLRQFGNQVWIWNSRTQHATHIVLPATFGSAAGQVSASQVSASQVSASQSGPGPDRAPLTPQQLGRQILAAIGPTTVVSVQDNVTVAGQPAYQLALAPTDRRSLIGRVTIAVDGRHVLPLRVEVFARGTSRPAFQMGYTALSFGAPAVSNFTFTAPPGAAVKTINVPAPSPRPRFRGQPGGPPGPGHLPPGHPGVIGTGWTRVLALPPSDAEPAALRALLAVATPVQGTWGSGRLLRSALFSVLITSRGTVLAGAVTPAVLYAAARAVP
jgi:outer membrane lipoprotein-sorting protein